MRKALCCRCPPQETALGSMSSLVWLRDAKCVCVCDCTVLCCITMPVSTTDSASVSLRAVVEHVFYFPPPPSLWPSHCYFRNASLPPPLVSHSLLSAVSPLTETCHHSERHTHTYTYMTKDLHTHTHTHTQREREKQREIMMEVDGAGRDRDT